MSGRDNCETIPIVVSADWMFTLRAARFSTYMAYTVALRESSLGSSVAYQSIKPLACCKCKDDLIPSMASVADHPHHLPLPRS